MLLEIVFVGQCEGSVFNTLTPNRRSLSRYKKSPGCRTDVDDVTKKFFNIRLKIFFGHVRQKL